MGFVRSACGLFLALQPVAYSWDVPTEACRNTYMLNPPNAVSPIRDTTPESTDPCLNECQDGNIKVKSFSSIQTTGVCDGETHSISVTGDLKYYVASTCPTNLYDVGMWVGSGDSCNVYGFDCQDDWAHERTDLDSDTCADLRSGYFTYFKGVTFEVPCKSYDYYGNLELDYCVSWFESNVGEPTHCYGANDLWEAAHSADSKCDCGTRALYNVKVCPVDGDVEIKKVALTYNAFCEEETNFKIELGGIPKDASVTYVIKQADGDVVVGSSHLSWHSRSIRAVLKPGSAYTLELNFKYRNCGPDLDCRKTIVLDFTPECSCSTGRGCYPGCPSGYICCPDKDYCDLDDATACGDPHMTGFLGQKFDFTGVDGGWYSLIADENMHINMRVTSPVADLPEITYITGLSVFTTDVDGFDHSIVVEVKDPHNLDSSCPAGVSPCLADGSLRVVLDGEEGLRAPGIVSLGPDVEVSVVNLPGACRSFGFEKYWDQKQLEYASAHGRRLGNKISMGEWILADPTATNMGECTEYVARAGVDEGGLFAHQSEHASFQIVTPKATIRLSHGRLHQVATRDPTDQFDLPDHLTWQMNLAVDHNEVSRDAKGVLGETFVPTRDANGEPIMTGMEAIRGKQEDYRVEGALGMDFVQDAHTS